MSAAAGDDVKIVPLHMEGDNNILTFGRMRPSKRLASGTFNMDYLDRSVEVCTLVVSLSGRT
jgi:hypothetical protein